MDPEKSASIIHYHNIYHAKCGADKFVLVGRQKVHYLEAGKGIPTILVPGSYSTFRVWNRIMPFLAQDFRVVAPDYLAEFDYTVGEQADLIAQIVRQLDLGKTNLIGGTQGGLIVVDFAVRYPELAAKIAIIGGCIIPPDRPRSESKKSKSTTESIHRMSTIQEAAKILKLPVLYLYSAKMNDKEIPLAKNLEFLQKYLPQAWIIALEGGIFETTRKTPQEVAILILDFLKARDSTG